MLLKTNDTLYLHIFIFIVEFILKSIK